MGYWLIGLVLAALLAYALIEPFRIQASPHTVAVPDLPSAFENMTILHLSDIHGRTGVFSFRPFLRWLGEADMIVITGDLYSPTLPRRRLAERLNSLTAPLGVYYISGNHDYRRGRLNVTPWDPKERLVDNEVRVIRRGDDQLLIAGLPDFVKGQPDWGRVRAALEGETGPAVLLAHRPDAWLLPGVERAALLLAGQTRGWQV